MSLIFTLSPDLRQVHQEQVGSLENQCNNIELMDLLKAMRQEIHERNKQLQIQLQLGDEYMDTKLRIRDQSLEETFRLRDESRKEYGKQEKEN